MQLSLRNGLAALVAFFAFLAFAPAAYADEPVPRELIGHVADLFSNFRLSENIESSASRLFWGLATISLVWTMGLLILRQDIGEVLMELIRFMVVTGILYWLLINASHSQWDAGFVDMIIGTFFQLPSDVPGDRTFRANANDILGQGFTVFFTTVRDVGGGDDPDRILGVAIATLILVLLACLAAQFLLMLVMAWVLGYAGIFLLGFGGARWTSPIAISYYKHVVAVGIAILTLTIIGSIGTALLHEFGPEGTSRVKAVFEYGNLGMVLGVSVLMLVLGLKVPQLMFTLVTQSPLGFYTGTATAAGQAFASGGSAIAASFQRNPDGGASGTGSAPLMSAASAGLTGGDPFHVGSGSDPFGVPRRADPLRHGTAFGRAAVSVTPIGDSDGGREPPLAPPSGSPSHDGQQASTRRKRPNYEAELAAASAAGGPSNDPVRDGGSDAGQADARGDGMAAPSQHRDRRQERDGSTLQVSGTQVSATEPAQIPGDADVTSVAVDSAAVDVAQVDRRSGGHDTALVDDLSSDPASHASTRSTTDHAAERPAPISASRASHNSETPHELPVDVTGRADVRPAAGEAGHSGESSGVHMRSDGKSDPDDRQSASISRAYGADDTSTLTDTVAPGTRYVAGDSTEVVPDIIDRDAHHGRHTDASHVSHSEPVTTNDAGHAGESVEMHMRPADPPGPEGQGASPIHRSHGAVHAPTPADAIAPGVLHASDRSREVAGGAEEDGAGTVAVTTRDVAEIVDRSAIAPDGHSVNVEQVEQVERREFIDSAPVGDIPSKRTADAESRPATKHATEPAAPSGATRAGHEVHGTHEVSLSVDDAADVHVITSDAGHAGESVEMHMRPAGSSGPDGRRTSSVHRGHGSVHTPTPADATAPDVRHASSQSMGVAGGAAEDQAGAVTAKNRTDVVGRGATAPDTGVLGANLPAASRDASDASRASALPQGGEDGSTQGSQKRKGRKNALAVDRDEPVMGAALGGAAPGATAIAPGGVEAGVGATGEAQANADDHAPVRPRRKRTRKATQSTHQADLPPPEAPQPDAPDATPPEENNPS